MTPKEQIKIFLSIGCEDAIQEVRRTNSALSPDTLNRHIEAAIETGLVGRVEVLAQMSGRRLVPAQAERLTRRCLQLEWVVDALCAAKLGAISDQTRRELVEALVAKQIADNKTEALELLDQTE